MAEAEFYLHLEARDWWRTPEGPLRPRTVVAKKVTLRPPGDVPGVVVQMRVSVPDAAFMPLIADAVDVPLSTMAVRAEVVPDA